MRTAPFTATFTALALAALAASPAVTQAQTAQLLIKVGLMLPATGTFADRKSVV